MLPFLPSGTLGADARFVRAKGTPGAKRCTAGLPPKRHSLSSPMRRFVVEFSESPPSSRAC